MKKKTKQHEDAKENESKPQEHVNNSQWKVGGRINGNGYKNKNKSTVKNVVCCGGSPWCWAEGSGNGCVCVELYAVAVVGVVVVVVVVVVVSCLSRWCLPLLLVWLWSLLWL